MAHVIVVGAGINGLATAWWLLRRGARVTLLERFALGHDRGSSHGRSRITRSAYADADYVRLMQVAHREAWPALEADAGSTLLHPRDGCFFGPLDGPFQDYIAAVTAVAVDVDVLEVAEARRRFPMFRFSEGVGVVHDRTSAVVAAADTMDALTRLVRAKADVREGVTVRGIDPAAVAVETDRGRFVADRIVVTAGPWTGGLVPRLARSLTPVRQTVAYVDVPAAADFPVWAWRGVEDFYYGLPSFQRPGLKAANHRVSGTPDNPDGEPDAPDVSDVLAFLERHLVRPPGQLLAAERCFYTNTDNEDFVIDHHPDSPAIVTAAGMSGHGFKFGPLTGRILAELALDGVTSVAAFEACRTRFRGAFRPSESAESSG